jgi:hypothetical protein
MPAPTAYDSNPRAVGVFGGGYRGFFSPETIASLQRSTESGAIFSALDNQAAASDSTARGVSSAGALDTSKPLQWLALGLIVVLVLRH